MPPKRKDAPTDSANHANKHCPCRQISYVAKYELEHGTESAYNDKQTLGRFATMKEAIAAAKKAMGSYGENDYFEDYEETEPDASGQYEDFEASGTCPEGELMRVWVDKEGPVAFNMFRTDGDEDDDDDEDDKDEDDEDEEDGGEDELADVDQPAPGPAEIERSFQILREAMVKIEDEIKESVAEGLNEEALRRVVAIGLRERVKGFTDASGFI